MQTNETGKRQFVQLLETHRGTLRRICSVYARDPEQQQDLFQDMVLQLWRSYPSFRGQSSTKTWIYRVALNTALQARRKAARRPDTRAVLTDVPDTSSVSSESAEDVLLLRECVQELPPLDRAIVVLYLEERSYDEISEITGLSRSNVSVRLVRLKHRLRGALEEKGFEREAFS